MFSSGPVVLNSITEFKALRKSLRPLLNFFAYVLKYKQAIAFRQEVRMDGKARRQEIIRLLSRTSGPISGSSLSGMLGVSRQVIVQDIALLRTEHPILATAQGYLLHVPPHAAGGAHIL